MNFPIGVLVDSFGLPLEQGLAKAAALGLDGVQLYAVRGELAPENLTPETIRRVKDLLAKNRLAASAVCGDFGGFGFEIAEDNPARIEASVKVMAFALALGTRVVTTHIGVIPDDATHPRWAVMLAACRELGRRACELGGVFAIETGPEPCALLREFLLAVDSPGIGVNFDPANLCMVTGDDPVAGVGLLAPYIVHTHAKDGVNLRPCDRTAVYHGFATGGVESLNREPDFIETPLGQGSVDFLAWLGALWQHGYRGYLTIERECGDDPAADIALAVSHLQASMQGK